MTAGGSPGLTNTTAIPITAYYSPAVTDTIAAGAVTVDCDDAKVHHIVLASGANTITLANPHDGITLVLYLYQPASGAAGTVTFSPVPNSESGVLPVLTTTNGRYDKIYLMYNGTKSKWDISAGLDLR
jgi:hypothetical protein